MVIHDSRMFLQRPGVIKQHWTETHIIIGSLLPLEIDWSPLRVKKSVSNFTTTSYWYATGMVCGEWVYGLKRILKTRDPCTDITWHSTGCQFQGPVFNDVTRLYLFDDVSREQTSNGKYIETANLAGDKYDKDRASRKEPGMLQEWQRQTFKLKENCRRQIDKRKRVPLCLLDLVTAMLVNFEESGEVDLTKPWGIHKY